LPFLFASIPWIALVVYMATRVRLPPPLASVEALGSDAPLVSVIVPARNEERSIRQCVESICASDYPAFEVIVVDDRSADETAQVARRIVPDRARRIVVVDGAELQEGWFGKPWACTQGVAKAEGEILLFTDADTVHELSLLSMTVAELEGEAADVLTVLGRQLMEAFWERLVQPQVAVPMLLRFSRMGRPCEPKGWRGALANGQYLLFKRSVYEELDVHNAVKNEVVEDQRLAQILCRAGKKLVVREGASVFATRMYRSLAELIKGWSKNMATGARQTIPSWARLPVMPVALFSGVTLWIMPPVLALLGLAGVVPAPWGLWAGAITAGSALFWAAATWRLHGPPWYGVFYPLGALVGAYIFTRSWAQGSRIEWKGRQYGA
jgi:chlorobactene glucosyltransferase